MSIQKIETIAELDTKLDEADRASKIGPAAYRSVLDGFVLDPRRLLGKLPPDPGSREYRDAQLRLYEHISKRSYLVENEETPFDHEEMMRWPFPYSSRSPAVVGDYLMTYGNLIRTMDLPSHARVLEVGSGYGPLTYQLASMGHSVTCLDMSESLLGYVEQRTRELPGRVNVVVGDMNDLRLSETYDVIIFFESFHHCSDPLMLLGRLPGVLEPGGMVVFAGEPIVPAGALSVPYPWGLRLDGMSLWVIRRLGWLELGYQEPYLHGLLEELGWSVVRKPSTLAATMTVWMAKRKVEDSPFAIPLQSHPMRIWMSDDSALHSQLSRDVEGERALRSNGQLGYLLFGPYVALDSGFYEVQWHGLADQGSKFSVDIVCGSGSRVIKSADVQFGARSPGEPFAIIAHVRFKVDEPAHDFEFRVRVDAAAEVCVNKVELRRY